LLQAGGSYVVGTWLHLHTYATPWHLIFESLAYLAAFRYYTRQREQTGDFLPPHQRSSIVLAAILGAVAGSKILDWLEDPAFTLAHWREPAYIIGGKTIVGALLGGTLAVELIKKKLGVRRRTGDLFAVPLTLGIMIGRVGCFLNGLSDHTYGNPTSLPWAVDFGDGIPRHPTQLYEILALALALPFLRLFEQSEHEEGDVFRVFLFGYLAWRFAIEFIKPDPTFGGLNSIQWVSAAALVWYARDIVRICRRISQQQRKPLYG
jgi:prolipoprotein diacylglyceryltransferase